MNSIRQTLAITAINLRSIPQRIGTSLVICVGIAGVVAVLTSLRAFVGNAAAMAVWGLLIVAVIGAGFALFFASLGGRLNFGAALEIAGGLGLPPGAFYCTATAYDLVPGRKW